MGYEQYRTPAELDEEKAEQAVIQAAIDEAKVNLGFALHAIDTVQPQATVDMWVDKLYDTLRARLEPELRLRAVVALLVVQGQELADTLSSGVGDDDVAEVCSVWAEQGYGDTP